MVQGHVNIVFLVCLCLNIQEHNLDVLNNIYNSYSVAESELIFNFKRVNSKQNWKSLEY